MFYGHEHHCIIFATVFLLLYVANMYINCLPFQRFVSIERLMLTQETVLPVYFTTETEEVADIYRHIRSSANGTYGDMLLHFHSL